MSLAGICCSLLPSICISRLKVLPSVPLVGTLRKVVFQCARWSLMATVAGNTVAGDSWTLADLVTLIHLSYNRS